MKVKKTLMDMIIKWHQAGYSLDEIAPTDATSPQRGNQSNHPTHPRITRNPTFRPGSWHHHKPDYTRRRESNK